MSCRAGHHGHSIFSANVIFDYSIAGLRGKKGPAFKQTGLRHTTLALTLPTMPRFDTRPGSTIVEWFRPLGAISTGTQRLMRTPDSHSTCRGSCQPLAAQDRWIARPSLWYYTGRSVSQPGNMARLHRDAEDDPSVVVRRSTAYRVS